MSNLLFTTLIIVLLYYFFAYLPSQKKLNLANPPLKHHQFTQTESKDTLDCPGPQFIKEPSELAELKIKHQELTTKLKTNQQDYQNELRKKQTQITNLQSEIRDLAKRPLKPTNSKGTQTDAETELTNTLDTLIKDIQELNNEL